jgi:hypothetical protein
MTATNSFPFETKRCSAHSVYDDLYRLSLEHERAGLPGRFRIVLGNDRSVRALLDGVACDLRDPREIEQAALDIDPLAWLEAEANDDPDYYEPARGPWPENAAPQSGGDQRRALLAENPDAEVTVAIIDAGERWRIPTILKYGGWNASPPPEVHAALWRRWEQAYGVQVSWVGYDELGFSLMSPFRGSRESALALAREQFLYCPDLVHQMHGTLENLAASLIGAKTWNFWWD